jgi:hypothetical protein
LSIQAFLHFCPPHVSQQAPAAAFYNVDHDPLDYGPANERGKKSL